MNAGIASLALVGTVASAILLGVVVPSHMEKLWIKPQVEVIDGDTFTFGKERVRLWGIDAPELSQTCLDENLRRYDCGKQARNALQFILSNYQPRCFRLATDRYGRAIAQCYAGTVDRDIGALLVTQGWALDDFNYSKGRYKLAEDLAQSEKRGLHAGPFLRPEEFRRQHRQGDF